MSERENDMFGDTKQAICTDEEAKCVGSIIRTDRLFKKHIKGLLFLYPQQKYGAK